MPTRVSIRISVPRHEILGYSDQGNLSAPFEPRRKSREDRGRSYREELMKTSDRGISVLVVAAALMAGPALADDVVTVG